jgi:hypothetical protein
MRILISNESIWLNKEAGGWNPLKRVWRGVKEWASDDYKDAMENLRQIDSEIREWTDTLRSFLKKAEEAQRQGRHLDVVTWLNEINQRLRFISSRGKGIEDLRDDQIKQFYLQHEETPVNPHDNIVQAGIIDNTKRWLATRQLKEQYGKKIKLQRQAVETLFTLCKRTINGVESNINEMERLKDYGDIESYIEKLGKISALQKTFETKFLAIFDEFFAADVAKINAASKANKEKSQEKSQQRSERISNRQLPLILDEHPIETNVPPANDTVPESTVPESTVPESTVPESTVEEVSKMLNEPFKSKKKRKTILPSTKPILVEPEGKGPPQPGGSIEAAILADLAKTSDVKEFAMKVMAMSESLEETDPDRSIELLIIAERLLED